MTRIVIAARWPIVLAWVAAVAAALAFLPTLSSSSSPVDDIIPSDSSAIATQARSAQLFGVPAGSDVVVVQRRASGLTGADVQAHVRSAARGALPIVNEPIAGMRWGEQRTTALDFLFLDPDRSLQERRRAGQDHIRALGLAPGSDVGVTGAGPARLAQFEHIEDRLPLITAATVLVVVLMTALYFRTLGAALVTLATAGIAYVVAVRGVAWLSREVDVTVPREIEPLLVVLLLGLGTDYCVFFLAEARRRMREGADRLEAARGATARIGPLVLTAGTIVAACSAALLAGELEFFRVFGPGMAFCALVATLVAVTLVPALLAIFGDRLFGAVEPAPSRTSRVSRVLAARPVAALLAVGVIAGLGFAAERARHVDLEIDTIGALPKSDEVRRAGDDAQRGFAPGILAPTEVVLDAPGIRQARAQRERLAAAIARRAAVVTNVGTVARRGDAARVVVLFKDDATSAEGLADFRALRDAMPGLVREAGLPTATKISYSGESALGAEIVDAVRDDLLRIAIAIAVVTFLLLAVFLRALVAPLLVLAAGALGFVAALGLTTLILGDEITYFVPLVAGVLVVALGSDYNVLVAGRVRAESERHSAREAIAVAVPQASRAITVAGATLAASFALLALVPLQPFRELALLLCMGVLVDALLVRSVLIPSLLALFGRAAWWPSRPPIPPEPTQEPAASHPAPDAPPRREDPDPHHTDRTPPARA
ncbi:MAG TPA: MMPL family transporter [Solirubrobacteraceae bacterium]